MSVWDDIDRLKKAHEAELATTHTLLHNRYGKREANSLKILDGGLWRCLHDRVEYTARTSAELLKKLPKPPGKR